MSVQLGKVVSLLLSQRFGPVVEKVGSYLFEYGTSPLLFILKSTKLPLSKVKESLAILVKFQLVTFSPNKNVNIANYCLKHDRVLLFLRYPKYMNLIKKKFGDAAEMILEEIFQRGYWTASEIILKVDERLKSSSQDSSLVLIRDKFVSLVTAKYLIRIAYDKSNDKSIQGDEVDKPVPSLEIQQNELHAIPPVDLRMLANNEQSDFPDKGIYWAVNFNRFHEDMRDKIISKAFAKKFDENAGEFIKLLLQQMYISTEPWASVSNPIPIIEIKDLIKKQPDLIQLNSLFDQYVSIVEQHQSKLVRKYGEASGGSLQIYLKEAFIQFAWEIIEQCILEKFDSKAARIFRLVKVKKYIDLDTIQQLVMLPAKEAKGLCYQLLEENFLRVLELKRATANGPNKSFMLFHIKLDQTVRMILEMCYKTLFNIITRRNHEYSISKRLIEKKQRVDTILMSMKAQGASEEQLADIEDMITPPERELLEKIEKTMKKLSAVELEIDDTMFMLEMYLVYQ